MSYYEKYLKYKNKYIILQKQIGGNKNQFNKLIQDSIDSAKIEHHNHKPVSWSTTTYNAFALIYKENIAVYLGYGIKAPNTIAGMKPLVTFLDLPSTNVEADILNNASTFLTDATNQIEEFRQKAISNYGTNKHLAYIPSSCNALAQNASKLLILGTIDRIQPYNFHDKFIVLGSNKWSLGMNMLLIYYALHGLLPGMSRTTTNFESKIIILIPHDKDEWNTETRYSPALTGTKELLASNKIRIAYEELLFINDISIEPSLDSLVKYSLVKFKQNPSNSAQKLTIKIDQVCSVAPGHPTATLANKVIDYYQVSAKYKV